MPNLDKQAFIEFMMQSDVLRFGEFKTKSGRLSPYFINTGNYKTGSQIATLGKYYANCIVDSIGDGFDAMFGPAYKGIPLVTAAAMSLATDHNLDKPFFFNRKEAKDHGEGGSLVGYIPKDGDRIAIIEDVITAGTAVRETVPILKAQGDVTVSDMFISVNRCEVGADGKHTAVQEVKEQFGITIHAIVNVTDIYEFLGKLPEYAHVLPLMREYMDKYCVLG